MKISLQQRKDCPYLRNLYNRFKNILLHIHDRCNNIKNAEYNCYGGKGVSYCDNWNTVNGFILDVDSIPGWDLEKFLNHELQLDKDIKIPGNLIYSPSTCLWVSRKENMRNQPARMIPFWGYNLNDSRIIKRNSIADVAEKIGVTPSSVSNVIHKHKKTVSGWTFWYCSDKIPNIKKYWISIDGILYYGFNMQSVSKLAGKNPSYFINMTKNIKYASGKDHWITRNKCVEIWIENVDIDFYISKGIKA